MEDLLVKSLLIGAASWRMASMLVNEDGPALIFERLRSMVGANKEGEVEGFLPTLFSCIYCMSVWTTFTAFLIWIIEPILVMLIAAMSVALVVNFFAKPD